MRITIFFFLLFPFVSLGQIVSKPDSYQGNAKFEAASIPNPNDLQDSAFYKLVSVEAIDYSKKHSREEMTGFKNEAEEVFAQTNMIIDLRSKIWYYISRNAEKESGSKEFIIDNNEITFVNCGDCQDNTFSIIKISDDSLVVQLKPQDEGQYFMYQFNFKR